MKLFGPTRTPWFGFAMMRLRELLIAFQVDDQIIIRARLPDPQPGEERDQKQHRHDWHVVRRRNDLPNLVPILNGIDEEPQQHNHHRQAAIPVAARSSLWLSLDD